MVLPANVTALTADRESPIPTGVATTFTATATPGSLPVEYQFERRDGAEWSVVQPYSTSATYAWTPQAVDAGDHELKVLVRGVGSTDPYDAMRTLAFTVASGGAFLDVPRERWWTRWLSEPAAPVALSVTADLIVASGSQTVHSIYGQNLELLAEGVAGSGASGVPTHEYLWLNGEPIAQVESSTGAVDYYFNDHLGTPILQTNAAAAVTWRVEYEPYGTVFATRAGAEKHQPLRFPGQE